jgi:hypothetical protein
LGSEAWSPSISEELRRRAVAPRRRRAEGRYIGAQPGLCQHPGAEKTALAVPSGNSNLLKRYRGFTAHLKAPARRTAATFLRPSCHRFGRCHFGGNCVGVAGSARHGSPNDRARRLGHGPLTDREGRGVCRSFKSTPVVLGRVWHLCVVAVDRPGGRRGRRAWTRANDAGHSVPA